MHFGGLVNFANTCYLNTTIQCLGHCSAFRSFVLQNDESSSEILRLIRDVFKDLYIGKRNVSPVAFARYAFEAFAHAIEPYQQNDANDFLMALIDKLNQQLSSQLNITRETLLKTNMYTNSDFDVQRFKMDVSWYQKTGKEYSPLVPMFHGQSISQIICGHCGKIFHNYEIYCNLMLPITNSTQNLNDCLDEYFKEETVNSDAQVWTCDGCGKKAVSKKTAKLWRNPEILIVSLKRFTHDLRKNDKRIETPETLDLTRHCLTRNANLYKLVAVAHHRGSRGGGHYYATCRNSAGEWIDYDDLSVSPNNDPGHSDGYVFFYSSS